MTEKRAGPPGRPAGLKGIETGCKCSGNGGGHQDIKRVSIDEGGRSRGGQLLQPDFQCSVFSGSTRLEYRQHSSSTESWETDSPALVALIDQATLWKLVKSGSSRQEQLAVSRQPDANHPWHQRRRLLVPAYAMGEKCGLIILGISLISAATMTFFTDMYGRELVRMLVPFTPAAGGTIAAMMLVLALPSGLRAVSRQVVPVGTNWQLSTDEGHTWDAAHVPGTFEDQISRDFDGIVWLRCLIQPVSIPAGCRLLLHCEAVATDCQVLINGQQVGRHLGGWTPFRTDVTEAARRQTHSPWELLLKVDEKVGHNTQGFCRSSRRTSGGVWQDVQLLIVPATYIDDATVPRPAATSTAVSSCSNCPQQGTRFTPATAGLSRGDWRATGRGATA